MAFKTFAPGVLTSSDVNTFLMQQAVITCTSSTRPASPVEGMTIYETDTDAYVLYDGSNWVYQGHYQSFTPTISGVTLGNGTLNGSYATIGNLVHYRGDVVAGSTTTLPASPSSFFATLPVAPDTSPSIVLNFGGGFFVDDSLGDFYPLTVAISSGPLLQLRFHLNPTGTQILTAGFNTTAGPVTLAAGDGWRWSIVYEAA